MRKLISNEAVRRYAIGDLHGCLEQTVEALRWCAEDARKDFVTAEVVLLGDYVDKGPRSRDVIKLLMQGSPDPHIRYITLRGNHDDLLQRVHADHTDEQAAAWWEFGGQQTLVSYGWDPLLDPVPGKISEYVPHSHAEFIRDMPLIYETDDLIFVHAGLNKAYGIDDQTDRDLMWIRGPFLNADHDFGKPVVHGHSPDDRNPFVSDTRIGLDMACFGSGKLVVAVFEPGERKPRLHMVRKNSFENVEEASLSLGS